MSGHYRFKLAKIYGEKKSTNDNDNNDNDNKTDSEDQRPRALIKGVVKRYVWRAFCGQLGKTYFANTRGKLWDKIKTDLDADQHYRRKGKWLVVK